MIASGWVWHNQIEDDVGLPETSRTPFGHFPVALIDHNFVTMLLLSEPSVQSKV